MVAEKTIKRKQGKWQATVQMLLVLGIALIINFIAQVYYKRVDLTADNRYTISPPTENLVEGLKDVVFVKVYLVGDDLPAGFRRLSDATRELLDELRQIGGDKIQYQFINPDDMPDPKSRKDLFEQLASEGLNPVTVEVNETDNRTQKVIIPGAIVTYNNKSVPVELLQQQIGNIPPEEVLHNSVIGIEYQMANAIRKLQIEEKPKIAFIQGHGELQPVFTEDIAASLDEYYQVDYVNLPQYKVGRLDDYKAIIIAKPDSFFTELEKYKIDQYIMRGGKVLWFVDPLHADLDSMTSDETFTYDYKLNLLEDFLFKYGVRINYNLVQDLSCNYIPVVTPYGQMQRKNLLKWPFYPVAISNSDHPVVNNISAVWFSFASTIDTVNSRSSEGIKKTVLLQSSPYSRVMMNPVQLDVNRTLATFKRDEPLFRQGPQNLAVLLEGSFQSNFINRRPSPETLATGEYGEFVEQGKPSKMIVVSDGDVIKSQVIASKGQVLPLGYDRYSNQTFGNKTFVLNAVDYLVDESGLITLRSKDIKLRLLNTGRIKTERFNWQLFNLVVPLVILVIFGLVFNFVRRRRFA